MAWLLTAAVCGVLCVCGGDELPPGHLQPIGSHREPELVATLSAMPTSRGFYLDYVKASTPVLLKGLLNSTALLKNWGSDEYLRGHFGKEEVGVEHKKKENRSETGFATTMADYLDRYITEDIYMVSPLTGAMAEEWLLPQFMLCGGFTDNLVISYTWFSSGGTRSVLHTDAHDNLHCLVSGVKEFVLIDPQYIDTIGPEHRAQGFYNIDVDHVDMLSHPGLVSVPWHLAMVWPGDCLYIPHMWVHHVRSHDRNLGVNIWWTQFQYDPKDCSQRAKLPEFAPLSSFEMAPELQLKGGLLDHMGEDGIIHATAVHQTLITREHLADLKLEDVMEVFDILKPGCQGQLLPSDVHALPVGRYKMAMQHFMSLEVAQQSEGEEEGEWWEGEEWGGGGWEEGEEGEWGYSEDYDYMGDEEEGGGDYPHDHHSHDEL